MTHEPTRAGAARRLPAGLTCHRPLPHAPLRLVCFAHAGGGPATYRTWPAALAAHAEVWTVTLPGRGGRAREPFATEWEPLVAEIADVLAGWPGRTVLFGHSLGALVAFETARALTERGNPPVRLVVSGRAAPVLGVAAPAVPGDDTDLVDMLDRHFGGIPEAVRALPDLLAHFLPVVRADLTLLGAYRYRPAAPLPCPITPWTGDEDLDATPERLRPWAFETTARCEPEIFPGGHFYLRDDEPAALAALTGLLTGTVREDAAREAGRDGRATAV